MSYEQDLARAGVAPLAWSDERRGDAQAALDFHGDLSSRTLTADVRLYPDAPGAALVSPTVTQSVKALSVSDWASAGTIIPKSLGYADDDFVTLTTVTMTIPSASVQALPRNGLRGESSRFVWSVGDNTGRLAAGPLIITETA